MGFTFKASGHTVDTPREYLRGVIGYGALVGGSIPANDDPLDLANLIAEKLGDFFEAVERARSTAQAGDALEELADIIKSACYDVRVQTQKGDSPT